MSQDPLARILTEAESNRRRERAAQASATTTATSASTGDYTVGTGNTPGNPVILDANGKIPAALTYPPNAGNVARTYQHTQAAASTIWQIAHSLGGYPPVVVLDDNGALITGEVSYPDDNHVTVVFGRPKSGVAHLSL